MFRHSLVIHPLLTKSHLSPTLSLIVACVHIISQADILATDKDGATALTIACFRGNADTVQQLLAAASVIDEAAQAELSAAAQAAATAAAALGGGRTPGRGAAGASSSGAPGGASEVGAPSRGGDQSSRDWRAVLPEDLHPTWANPPPGPPPAKPQAAAAPAAEKPPAAAATQAGAAAPPAVGAAAPAASAAVTGGFSFLRALLSQPTTHGETALMVSDPAHHHRCVLAAFCE